MKLVLLLGASQQQFGMEGAAQQTQQGLFDSERSSR